MPSLGQLLCRFCTRFQRLEPPIFGTFAIAFIARGLRTNHRADFAIGGAMLGLSQYFVDAGRVFFPAILIVWLGLGETYEFQYGG